MTLDTKERKNYFIGVLDIAGFEIFDVRYLYWLSLLVVLLTVCYTCLLLSTNCMCFNFCVLVSDALQQMLSLLANFASCCFVCCSSTHLNNCVLI